MAKVKLLRFEIASLLEDSKGIVEYLQKSGIAHLVDIDDESLVKYDTQQIVSKFEAELSKIQAAVSFLEKNCNIKRGLIESFTDFKVMSYDRYKALSENNDEASKIAAKILELEKKIDEKNELIIRSEKQIEAISPWRELDIMFASKRTLTSRIFIGSFNRKLTAEQIFEQIKSIDGDLEEVAIEVIRSEKLLTCAVIICHNSIAERLNSVLHSIGFILPDNIKMELPLKTVENENERIRVLLSEIEVLKKEASGYIDYYDSLRFLYDWLCAQIDKYKSVSLTASSEKVFFISGYFPESYAEEFRFVVENKYNGHIETYEPDYDNPEVPVLLQNGSFASGVENITETYSPVSNKDIDPNPVMAFFYYAFFGLMLSDAGYGALMVIFAIFAEKKLKARGSFKKTVNMIFYSGISSIIFGALFGGWFGDLIPVVCTNFLGYEQAPELALWLNPVKNGVTLLVYCLGFGILHLFAGLLLNGYKLIKNKKYFDALSDTLPVMIFVAGFAIFGCDFLIEIPDNIKSIGIKLLLAGALLIVLTAGRNSRNIIGKFGVGLYALYNTASGYLGDILSYSRLLALGLVTGVIASSINLMATMPGNVFLFIVIFIIGHTINIAINLLGTYVHTNRLQYVEFFSKFYEGDGKTFTPFRINSKHIIIKEDK